MRWIKQFNSRETPMKSICMVGKEILMSCQRKLILAGMAAFVLSMPGLTARAADNGLSKDSKACLECHDNEGMEKKLENGEMLSLHISAKGFADSTHGGSGCESCHSDIDSKKHPKDTPAIKSKRDYSLGKRETCRMCHDKKFTEYEGSAHAALIKEGSTKAPMCTDCHNPHTVRTSKAAEPISATPCAKCHVDIFNAYAQDVHGRARTANVKGAPICADCHRAHDVKAASLGENMKNACLSCHKNAVAAHREWLPNTERHFTAISCPACHAPTAQRRVNLRLYDGVAKRQISEKIGVPQFEMRANAADTQNVGLDERALWSLLKTFSQNGTEGNTALSGRLEVRSGVEAHQISEKAKAIKECDACHKYGAEPFQSVTLTIAGPDGRPLRHTVQKEVLNSLVAMESVRGFYATGGTRIKLLDILLVLVVVGSICVPIGHMTMKWLFRRVRARLAAEKIAAIAQADSQALTDIRRNADDASKH
jgi:hypothetical protein